MVFEVKQEKFEGPLDLLLDLIEKEKLSISEVSLGKVTDEYLKEIRSIDKINPEELAEFLVVAAQLMLIKSRSLLPTLELSPEEEESIEELEKRLEEYRHIRELVKELKTLELKGMHIYTREVYGGVESVFYPPKKISEKYLFTSFSTFIKSLPKLEKLTEERLKKIISLEEKIKHIRSFLHGAVERVFSDIIKGTKGKTEIIVSFLALLELARQQFVDLRQEKTFGEIIIKKL